MLSTNLKELASLGLPLTTIGTIGLYFVGLYYYDGYFAFWGVDARSAHVDLTDILRPCSLTIIVLWQAALGYAQTRQVMLARQVPGTDGQPADLHVRGLERAYSYIVLGLWLASMAWLAWAGKPTIWAILIGMASGTIIAIARSWKWTVHKMGLLALMFGGLCWHARWAGMTEAAAQVDVVTITTKSKQVYSLLAIHQSTDGFYGIDTSSKTRSVLFIPRQEIATLTLVRR